MILNEQFHQLLNELKAEVKILSKTYPKFNISYSLVGSIFQTTKTLILGNNWGGSTEMKSQMVMPLVNDILAYPSNSTYNGYLKFFTILFDNDQQKLIDFFQKIVYSNGCLIRTPNEDKEFGGLLMDGYTRSKPIIKSIIEETGAKNIICFGNSELSSTRTMSELLLESEIFWKVKSAFQMKLSNNNNSYHFTGNLNDRDLQVFSFPHSSKIGIWGKDIINNKVFQKLKTTIL